MTDFFIDLLSFYGEDFSNYTGQLFMAILQPDAYSVALL